MPRSPNTAGNHKGFESVITETGFCGIGKLREEHSMGIQRLAKRAGVSNKTVLNLQSPDWLQSAARFDMRSKNSLAKSVVRLARALDQDDRAWLAAWIRLTEMKLGDPMAIDAIIEEASNPDR